jgi:hypothetical protein
MPPQARQTVVDGVKLLRQAIRLGPVPQVSYNRRAGFALALQTP